jgi:hypothetical protein
MRSRKYDQPARPPTGRTGCRGIGGSSTTWSRLRATMKLQRHHHVDGVGESTSLPPEPRWIDTTVPCRWPRPRTVPGVRGSSGSRVTGFSVTSPSGSLRGHPPVQPRRAPGPEHGSAVGRRWRHRHSSMPGRCTPRRRRRSCRRRGEEATRDPERREVERLTRHVLFTRHCRPALLARSSYAIGSIPYSSRSRPATLRPMYGASNIQRRHRCRCARSSRHGRGSVGMWASNSVGGSTRWSSTSPNRRRCPWADLA